jgi:uncharacterized protein (DUF1697 family)
VTRTAAEIAQVAESNPFLPDGADPDTLHVAFLAETPSSTRVDSLDKDRSPPDKFAVSGREVYLHCPNGFARTKLTTDYLDKKLGTTSTVRNWRTVLKLLELTGGWKAVSARPDRNDGGATAARGADLRRPPGRIPSTGSGWRRTPSSW